MGKTYGELSDSLNEFISRQKLFFVASAPLDANGHVNLSPKGLDSFRVIDARTVAYLDLTGSGIETVAHVKENGRLSIMFCALEGAPKIVRLYGRAEVIERDHPEFASLLALFPARMGTRSIIRVALERVADSCGYGVPVFEFREERSTLIDWADKKGSDKILEYQREKNQKSIDGLPGIAVK